jgi:hypothetical protein
VFREGTQTIDIPDHKFLSVKHQKSCRNIKLSENETAGSVYLLKVANLNLRQASECAALKGNRVKIDMFAAVSWNFS